MDLSRDFYTKMALFDQGVKTPFDWESGLSTAKIKDALTLGSLNLSVGITG
jgi:hypothetical protein